MIFLHVYLQVKENKVHCIKTTMHVSQIFVEIIDRKHKKGLACLPYYTKGRESPKKFWVNPFLTVVQNFSLT